MPVVVGGLDGVRDGRRQPVVRGRPAGVLVLVHPGDDGEARVVLTERADPRRPPLRRGRAFPAARPSRGDADIAATALREAAEEVGLDAEAAGVRVVGLLERFWIPVSDFDVTPVVAVADRRPGARRLSGRGRPDRRAAGRPVPARGPDRDRRADDPRLAAPLRRLPRSSGAGPSGARPPGSSASSGALARRLSRSADAGPGRSQPVPRRSDGLALARVAAAARRRPRAARPTAAAGPGRCAAARPAEHAATTRVVGAGQLDDERAHLGVLGPGASG